MTDKPRFFDELAAADGSPRRPYHDYHAWFTDEDRKRLLKKNQEAETFFRRTGITFNVYGEAEADERLLRKIALTMLVEGRAGESVSLTRGVNPKCPALPLPLRQHQLSGRSIQRTIKNCEIK